MVDTIKLMEAFIKLHDEDCNQKYGINLPYSFHLRAVWSQARKFSFLLNDSVWMKNPNNLQGESFNETTLVRAACFGHDSIEDARLSYNNVVEMSDDIYFGRKLADIIFCLTDEKGKNRAERKSDKYYTELRENKIAVFVKLADIAANTLFGKLTGSKMYDKYKEEFPSFKEKVYLEEYKEFFDYVENL